MGDTGDGIEGAMHTIKGVTGIVVYRFSLTSGATGAIKEGTTYTERNIGIRFVTFPNFGGLGRHRRRYQERYE